jgi:E3 ubiquitin-protein ligase MYLIP
VFSLHHSNSLTGILDNGAASQSNQQHQAFNFDTQEVLTRTRELESELQRLRSAMTCRVCQTEPLGATFCPCGHTVCCFHCANTLSRCWQCDVPIDNVQRMLLA